MGNKNEDNGKKLSKRLKTPSRTNTNTKGKVKPALQKILDDGKRKNEEQGE